MTPPVHFGELAAHQQNEVRLRNDAIRSLQAGTSKPTTWPVQVLTTCFPPAEITTLLPQAPPVLAGQTSREIAEQFLSVFDELDWQPVARVERTQPVFASKENHSWTAVSDVVDAHIGTPVLLRQSVAETSPGQPRV